MQLESLENEKSAIEEAMTSGNLNAEEIVTKSNRLGEIIKLIDEKSDRWLELSSI
jgi:ABC transport system ATP-binding/permease protein